MPTSATLQTISPNCENADFYLSGGAIITGTGGQVYINVYLVNADGTETQIYEGDPDVDTNSDSTINFNVSSLTSGTNTLYDTGNATLDAIIEGITNFNGLFNFEFISNDGETNYTASTYTLGTCTVDCCMANLVSSAIDCSCGCDCEDDICNATLKKVEKILILIKCAIIDANGGDPASALSKYNKAVELCDSTCDCNC
jgi:hypothetical protein